MYECKRETEKGTRYKNIELSSLNIAKCKAPYISTFSVFLLAPSIETADLFS